MCLGFPYFPKLPMELQREIFLLFQDAREVHRYAHVASAMHMWLEPYLYRVVRLCGDDKAKAFIDVVKHGSRALTVQKLVIAMAVTVPSMVQILTLCQKVEELAIQPSLRFITSRSINPLLDPMSDLLRINAMYADLAVLAPGEVVNLPDFPWFDRLTKLHLGLSRASLGSVPQGFASLTHLTHLSMLWYTSRLCYPELVKFLAKESTVTLIIWVNDWVMESTANRKLRLEGLQGTRVVILRSSLMIEYMANGGFWQVAERIVQWRLHNKANGHEYPPHLSYPSFFRSYRRGPAFYIL